MSGIDDFFQCLLYKKGLLINFRGDLRSPSLGKMREMKHSEHATDVFISTSSKRVPHKKTSTAADQAIIHSFCAYPFGKPWLKYLLKLQQKASCKTWLAKLLCALQLAFVWKGSV